MSEKVWEDWDGFKDLQDGSYIPPEGGGGELPPELVDKINNSISKDEVSKLLDDFNHSKDMVFKLLSPINIEPQEGTDTPYPHDGIVKRVLMSVSLDSEMRSNVMASIERYDTNSSSWNTITGIIQLNINQGMVSKDLNKPISKNDRLRVNIIEGNTKGIKDLTLILNIE